MRAPAALLLAVVGALSACTPAPPEGLDVDVLNREIGRRIGDPTTCVLVARADDGKVVHRYGSAVICGRAFPACEAEGTRTAEDLLRSLGTPPRKVTASCPTAADGSRSVGWAAGPVENQPLVFAAVMEGQRALPGLIMTDRLARAFAAAKID